MDKKKKIARLALLAMLAVLQPLQKTVAQTEPGRIEFCGYNTPQESDTITLYLKFIDDEGNHIQNLRKSDIKKNLLIKEDGKEIAMDGVELRRLNEGQRIPDDYTISVLIDQNIPSKAKKGIREEIDKLVGSAPEGGVFLSFFGEEVTESQLIDDENKEDVLEEFDRDCDGKSYFYDAVYAKLVEFCGEKQEYEDLVGTKSGYRKNRDIACRAEENPDKNLLFIFMQGTDVGERVFDDDYGLNFGRVTDYRDHTDNVVPRIYAFYYTDSRQPDSDLENLLKAITRPRGEKSTLAGEYLPSDSQEKIIDGFKTAVDEAKYDWSFIYKVADDASYNGPVSFTACWDDDEIGKADYSIGTEEAPWPVRKDTPVGTMMKMVWAVLVTLLTIAFFFFVMKILVPAIKSSLFSAKYYKPYQPEQGVNKRTCYYCRKELLPGEKVVTKCQHIMHVTCWKYCGYHCAEYGQNCNTGLQEHVDWQEMFTRSSLRDCRQAFAGILAGFAAWVVFELTGRGILRPFAKSMASLFLEGEKSEILLNPTVMKLAAFFTIGLVLAFFLSLVFRYNDEYRNKNTTIIMKIIGLSLFSAVVGLAAFIVGGILLCMILSSSDLTTIPWYCSFPAYLLFSVCTTLSLTVKSSIPVKSAMIGGLCSSVIGFLVLYFSDMASDWLQMLLNFIIYGGGLGASLVTVRMLAEKYFLVITNGVKKDTRIPIHKWMNATGGGQHVAIGMSGDCEIQMNWDKSNRVAKEHAQLYIDQARSVPVIKPMEIGVTYNSRADLPKMKAAILTNGDTFQIGETIFRYEEND